jgi:sigma-B regulation protein RsbU (phosphoserine phosphatase)
VNILIADDDAIPRRLLQATLMKAGHSVICARDGAEAWQMLQSADAPRLAILDWLMPGLDGVEVCRRVRQRQNAPYTYLILLTSKDRKEDSIAGLEAGADDYLTKPFDPQELHVRLRTGQRILDLQTALLTSLEQLEQAHHREIEIGAKIQQTLLLGQLPQEVVGAQVAALTMPSQQVDGDFYDFFQYRPHSFDIVIGDVMGKGVPAALLGAALKSALPRALCRLFASSAGGAPPEPEAIVRQVHREVTKQFMDLGVFATLCYARLDVDQRQLTLVDCGHPKTIHFRRSVGSCTVLQGDNMPLGFSEHEIYQQVVFSLGVGDVLVFYSDGITEARNADGEFFGVERLMEVIQHQHRLAPAQLIETIREAVLNFSGAATCADDFTCVVLSLEETEKGLPIAHTEFDTASDIAKLPLIRGRVRSFCQDLPVRVLDEESIEQLELAVTEATSNIIRHAYQGLTDQSIQLVADAFPDRIVVKLFHHGAAFDPTAVRPPAFDGSREGGFGVYIIAHSVDEVCYSHDEKRGNSIYLVKNRKAAREGEIEWN